MKTRDIHIEIEEWMAGALCGSLSADEQGLFDRHLAGCEACRSLYREEEIMNTMLEKEMAGLRPEPEFGDAMVSRFRERAGRKRGVGFGWVQWIGRLAFARPMQAVYAVLVLAAMVKTGAVLTGERGPVGADGMPIQHLRAAMYLRNPTAPASPAQKQSEELGFGQDMSNSIADNDGTRAMAQVQDQLKHATADRDLAYAKAAPELDNFGIARDRAPQKALGGLGTASFAVPMQAPVDGIQQRMADQTADRDTVVGRYLSKDIPDAAGIIKGADASASLADSDTTAPAPDDQRKLIRNASVQYEVADYSKATDTVNGLIAEEQGYVSTQNSDRGANGKLEGTVEVKLPPEHMDAFLLKLRVLGDLKGQTLTTEDVTKDYFDTDARMRNAQLEEQRLQDILNKDTGRLSDILQVERELARVRQSVEEMQGTLKYYNTMVQYATVTLSLSEKDMSAPAQFLLKERADLAIYAGDVDGVFAQAREIAASVKAQVLDSNVERNGNGETTATLSLLIDPDAADGAIARLKGLGRIQNFTSATQRVAQDGSGTSDTARTEKDKVEAHLTVLQDQETAAQHADVSVQAADVEGRLNELKAKAAALGAEVKGAAFERDASGSESGQVELRMPLRAYKGVLAAVKGLGDVKSLAVNKQEGATVTDNAPAEMTVQIFSQPRIVAADDGVWATIRRTLAEAFGAVMWSVRMIGVSLAFFAPWLVAIGLVVAGVRIVRRVRGKAE